MRGVGQTASAETALEVARQELGPCWSRWADDCMEFSDDFLKEEGLYADCERFIESSQQADDATWDAYIDALPYCEGFFDYDRMPYGRGHKSGAAEASVSGPMGSPLVLGGVAVGMMVLGLVIGKAVS